MNRSTAPLTSNYEQDTVVRTPEVDITFTADRVVPPSQ